MICPNCGQPLLEGEETCEKCLQSVAHLYRQTPRSELEQSVTRERIAILQPNAPLAVTPDTSVGAVLQLMFERSIGCVVVMDHERLAGIFTERDALLRLDIDAPDLLTRPISEFMTSKVESLDAQDKIAFALHKMDLGGFRHVPITQQGKVVGIISVRDILRYMTNAILSAG